MTVEGEVSINTSSGITKLRGRFQLSATDNAIINENLIEVIEVVEPERHTDKYEGRYIPVHRMNYIDPTVEVDIDVQD